MAIITSTQEHSALAKTVYVAGFARCLVIEVTDTLCFVKQYCTQHVVLASAEFGNGTSTAVIGMSFVDNHSVVSVQFLVMQRGPPQTSSVLQIATEINEVLITHQPCLVISKLFFMSYL